MESEQGNFSRVRRRRHLELFFEESAGIKKGAAGNEDIAYVSKDGVVIPQEFTPHQYAIFLLHVAAEIEHVLMVQYLYAGYSLGGPDVPIEHQNEVAQWREIILGIAKEEMGHLITMQNLLRCLGGPLNLDREDYPWESEFYPFPFMLEGCTRKSLAKYIVAEAPGDWSGEEADEIKELANAATGGATLHRVGKLFEDLEKLVKDETIFKDSFFRSSTYPYQANWDEWGRGYKGGARGVSVSGDTAIAGTPDLILLPVTARTDSLAAIKAVATQGEANSNDDDSAPSHFARFLRIFRKMPKEDEWTPSRKVPVNPVAIPNFVNDAENVWLGTAITNPESKCWAHLFNIRYRLLLMSLLHSFDYGSNLTDNSQVSPRGLLIHATFGEMYNLRALSEILMQSPLSENESKERAGPPFQMPYSMKLPHDLPDRWRLHLDLLESSMTLIVQLRGMTAGSKNIEYLNNLEKIDRETHKRIQVIIG